MDHTSKHKAAQTQAISWLSLREYSQLELTEKLLAKGHDSQIVLAVVMQLKERGLQSDRRLTESWIAKRQRQGYGPVRIKQELQHKGIATDLLTEQLDFYHEIWKTILHRYCQQKYGPVSAHTIKERWSQMQALQRRGFTKQQILQFFAEANCLLTSDEFE